MTTAPVYGRVMRNSLVTFGANEYTAQVTKARFVPDTQTQTLKTLVPDGVISDVDDPSWTLELEGPSDWTASQGLARYLNENAGTTVTVSVTPRTGGVALSCDVVLVSVPFGGSQGEWEMFEVEMPCNGQPEFDDPA